MKYRYHSRRGSHPSRSSARKPPLNRLKPGADPRLKKIFAKIGKPEAAEFVPDPFQLEALEAVGRFDCLVSAPTGAGKTWIARQAIAKVLATGGRSWYATPLKALSNAKLEEFAAAFGSANVGILTGDRKENPDAPVIVGTTEILRNQLYDAMHHGRMLDTDFVVLDEAHYLGDEDRGVVWEETMIYLPQRIPLLLLSATIGNADQIAAWLETIRQRPCRLVRAKKRPVPLFPLFLHPGGTLMPLLVKSGPKNKPKLYKKVADCLNSRRMPALAPGNRLPPFGQILKILRKYDLLPAIFFLKSRADCDNALNLCLENRVEDPERVATLGSKMDELARRFPHVARHRQRWALEKLAVGAHHSGQLPAWKQVLETLMSEGILDAIFATSTVAAGVDFPARTVAFLNSDRFNGTQFVALDSTQLQQMTGRAGRRGRDQVGFALVVPGKYMDVRQVARLLGKPPSPVFSQIRINFSMVLNLLLSHSPEQVARLLRRSFVTFANQDRKKGMDLETIHANLLDDFTRHLEFLKATGFVDRDDKLTEDGQWAAQLRIDQPLLVAEALRLQIFPAASPVQTAAVMASLVNDKETDEHLSRKQVPKKLRAALKKMSRGLTPLARHMEAAGFQVRTLYLKPAAAVFAWAVGSPWQKVVNVSQMAEGDLAMLVLRTADNLRHVRALGKYFPREAAAAAKAMDMIMREPVVSTPEPLEAIRELAEETENWDNSEGSSKTPSER